MRSHGRILPAARLWELPAAIVACELAGGLGALAGRSGFRAWYPRLQKPAFAPPSSVFGPVWTTLYALMGAALYLIRRRPHDRAASRSAQRLFAAQLGLNAAWTPLFFGRRSPLLGLLDIVPLLGLVALTVRAFARISRLAALLLVPYLLWVGFATVLNAAFVWKNRPGSRGDPAGGA